MPKPSLGDQELELLRFLAERAPSSIGEMTDGFGLPRGLARSTVNTMAERLHKKGYLIRNMQEGVYRYSPSVSEDELLGALTQHFVETTLGGSLAPFLAYFVRTSRLSDDEIGDLERIVAKLR